MLRPVSSLGKGYVVLKYYRDIDSPSKGWNRNSMVKHFELLFVVYVCLSTSTCSAAVSLKLGVGMTSKNPLWPKLHLYAQKISEQPGIDIKIRLIEVPFLGCVAFAEAERKNIWIREQSCSHGIEDLSRGITLCSDLPFSNYSHRLKTADSDPRGPECFEAQRGSA